MNKNIINYFNKSKEYINNYDRNELLLNSFCFYDSTWTQDLCPTYTKTAKNNMREVNIYFANSSVDNEKNDEFTHHSISFQSHYDEDVKIKYDFECLFVTHDINEIFSILKSNETLLDTWLNVLKDPKPRIEKKYIERSIEHIKSTLDVYDINDGFDDDFDNLIIKIAKYIKKDDETLKKLKNLMKQQPKREVIQ